MAIFTHKMKLENIIGNLFASRELEPDTFQHVDQLTTLRRTNLDLRKKNFHTADGELYTVKQGRCLWSITRQPQNLGLKNIEEAYYQFRRQMNYFPDTEDSQSSFDHPDSVVINLKELKLVNIGTTGYFEVNPNAVRKLNSEQRKAAQRIFGPDENNFGLNMEMFKKAGKIPRVFVLTPNYVQNTLRSYDKQFLWRSSSLHNFSDYSNFFADGHSFNCYFLRGLPKEETEANYKY
jgi:hypothetical protein